MKIAMMGSGGVGGFFGGRLAKAGYDVSFIARGALLIGDEIVEYDSMSPSGFTETVPRSWRLMAAAGKPRLSPNG